MMHLRLALLATLAAAAGLSRADDAADAGLRLDLDDPPAADPNAPPPPPAEADTPWSKGWKGTVDLGLNGSSGNSETLNFRGAAGTRRTTDRYDTFGDIIFTYSQDDGNQTANRLEANGRNDWIIPDSKWVIFADAKFEYDEFTDYDVRISGHAGAGYKFIKTDKDDLLGRIGVGAYKEFGSATNEIVPEGVLGVDYSHKFTDRQSFVFTGNFYPALNDFGPYRFDLAAAYQFLVDPDSNLAFKVGIEDRYDSTPGAGFKRNDFDYFLSLAWSW